MFRFDLTDEAANHNFKILEDNDFDLQKIITADPLSPLYPGSEWRPTDILQPIFQDHPLWNKIKSHCTDGVYWPTEPIEEQERLRDLALVIEYGNHKSAVESKEDIYAATKKEVVRGWQLPLPIDKIHLIPGAVAAPMGFPKQFTIDEKGNRYEKGRTTHDQSFNAAFKEDGIKRSVNDRVREEDLTPLEYGHTALRHIHRLLALREKHPGVHLPQAKIDF